MDETREAEGLEAKMVSMFNENSTTVLEKISKLTKRQKDTLLSTVPVRRFWHLSELSGIGLTTYSSLFKLCYDYALKKILL